MAKKKSTRSTTEQDLKATLKKVRARLAAAEESAQKWKTRAKAHRVEAKGLQAELSVVRRRLAKAEASASAWEQRAKAAPTPTAVPAAPAASTPPAARAAVPDESWTVTALRAEARSRGIAGYSRKTKQQLLVELGVSQI